MKRVFNDWFSLFRSSIADYRYYVDFDKVYANVDSIKVQLNILNSLKGSRNIEKDFTDLTELYPEVLSCIPILLAKREKEIEVLDNGQLLCYDFHKQNYDLKQYCRFMQETGLFELLQNHVYGSLVDYVTGVETGLDSNGRKNRGGHLMENLVECYLQKAGHKKEQSYYKEVYIHEIEQKWDIDLSVISNQGKTEKRFDFVLKTGTMIYGIETNFYGSGGSKLNETARSYKNIALETQGLQDFTFV